MGVKPSKSRRLTVSTYGNEIFKKPNVNPEAYAISDQTNTICGRCPNQVSGQQFRVNNCKNSHIYIFDHVNTVTVDNCSNCTLVFGAVKTSIFIRNCDDCILLAACQQFRLRNSNNITAFIAAVSDPIIETSSSIHFAPFQLSYRQIYDHFRAAGLNPFNCSYSSIHDFSSRGTASRNYDFLDSSADIKAHLLLPQNLDLTGRVFSGEEVERLKSVQASLEAGSSIVPPAYATFLIHPAPESGFALTGLFYHSNMGPNARNIIKSLREHSVYLVRSWCLRYTREDITRIFGDSTLATHSELGPAIMLLFYSSTGSEVGRICENVADELVRREKINPPSLITVTQDSNVASRQADMLAHFSA